MADTYSESAKEESSLGSTEDLTFIDDMVDIARRHEANFTAAAVLGEFSTSRYKNNWDDLDVLCAEITHRETLSKKTGAAYAVEFDNFESNSPYKETGSNCEEVKFEHFDNSSLNKNSASDYATESGLFDNKYMNREADVNREIDYDNGGDNYTNRKADPYYEISECDKFEGNSLRDEDEIVTVTHPTITEAFNPYFHSDSGVLRFVSNNNLSENCDKTKTLRTTGLTFESLNSETDTDCNRDSYSSQSTSSTLMRDSQSDIDNSKYLNSNNNNNNNNSFIKSDDQVLVPPPRKKKMARLKAAEKAVNSKPDRTTGSAKRKSVDTTYFCDKENSAIQSDSGISESTYNGLHVKTSSMSSSCDSTDHLREFSETGSKFSESLGSECEQAILSAVAEANANEWADEKTDGSFATNTINEKVSAEVNCETLATNDVIYRNKKRGRDSDTGLTGLTVDDDTSQASVYHLSSTACQFVSREAEGVEYTQAQGEFTDDNLSPGVSDKNTEDRRRTPFANLPSALITKSSHSSDPRLHDLNSSKVIGDFKDIRATGLASDQPIEANVIEIDGYTSDGRRSHSVYVNPSDLERVGGQLVVKPAVRRFSVSQDDESSRRLRESARLRRNSTAAVVHAATDTESTGDRISRHRSKSVSDLSRQIQDSSDPIKRNRSVSNRVVGAVGKLSLRIRHAFKPKSPTSQSCYIEEIPDDSEMSYSDRKLNCDSKCDKKSKKRSSKDFTDNDSGYVTGGRPVLATQPSDVKTVRSIPGDSDSAKPKGKFSSFFGLGGKKWYTIASLPKLLQRKSKDKYSKSDKASSASDQDSGSVSSAPAAGGKTRIVVTGRHAANAKEKIAKDRRRRFDDNDLNDMPTFISLGEYRLRMEEIEQRRQIEGKRRGGMGKRSRSLPYLDTSEEEDQIAYNTMRSEKGRAARPKQRPESYDENRNRSHEKDQRRISEPVDKTDRHRRYKRRDKPEQYSPDELPFLDVDKSTMAVDYGCDMYHFKGHPSITQHQSTTDLTYNSSNEARDRSTQQPRYSNQPRNRNSVAAPEDRGRRRPLQPRDRNSIAVPNPSSSESQRVPERWKKEKLPRPKSMTSLLQEESLSSEEDATGTRRRKEHKKPKAPQPTERHGDTSPEIDPLEDAIKRHLKHENGPLARRKIERKQTQDTGSMRRLKESFMAKKIWENVYDQLLQDLSGKGSNSSARKALETMRLEADEKSSSSRHDDGYYSRCSSHSSREESDAKGGYSRSASVEDEGLEKKSLPSRSSSRIQRSESCRDYEREARSKEDESGCDLNKSVVYEPMSLTLTRPRKNRRVWRPTDK